MPSFSSSVTVTEEVEIEFEVFCATCGAGNCHLAEGRNSHRRRQPQVNVEACPKCMKTAEEKGYENGRESRDQEVADLIEERDALSAELKEMRQLAGIS